MLPWETLDEAVAEDGTELLLRRRGDEYLILAGGYDLMSSGDEESSRALARLGCSQIRARAPRILVGGLGMGFTLREALDATSSRAVVEVAELVGAVADWNRDHLGHLAGDPLLDPRTHLQIGDVAELIQGSRGQYDAILLDVDNGPDALAHDGNEAIYGLRGLRNAYRALKPNGVLGVWSWSEDRDFTNRLRRAGFDTHIHRVTGSKKGRGRHHVIWTGQRRAGR